MYSLINVAREDVYVTEYSKRFRKMFTDAKRSILSAFVEIARK